MLAGGSSMRDLHVMELPAWLRRSSPLRAGGGDKSAFAAGSVAGS